jgi:2-C-methyl-D-erythritol 4-phosphate cytidylyltransferase
MKIVGIIAAGGSGTRFGDNGGKQLLPLAGRPVAAWAIDALAASARIEELIVICDPARLAEYAETLTAAVKTDKPLTFIPGGLRRADSVYAGLRAAAQVQAAVVAIHDGARPLLNPQDTDRALELLLARAPEIAGVVLGHPAIDTIKYVRQELQEPQSDSPDCAGPSSAQPESASAMGVGAGLTALAAPYIESTPKRAACWQAQTPQVFVLPAVLAAYEQARKTGFVGTDDASYLEAVGEAVLMQAAARTNLKITLAGDLSLAAALLADTEGELCE